MVGPTEHERNMLAAQTLAILLVTPGITAGPSKAELLVPYARTVMDLAIDAVFAVPAIHPVPASEL